MMLGAHLLVCWMSPSRLGAGVCGMGALLFSQCNMVWRSFVQAGGSGCQIFYSSLCSFSAKCGSSVSARFLIYRVKLPVSAL
jgi:hypothetical protein